MPQDGETSEWRANKTKFVMSYYCFRRCVSNFVDAKQIQTDEKTGDDCVEYDAGKVGFRPEMHSPVLPIVQ